MGHIVYDPKTHYIDWRADNRSDHDYHPWIETCRFDVDIVSFKKRVGFLDLLAVDFCLTHLTGEPEKNIFDQFRKIGLYNEIIETRRVNVERYRARCEKAKAEFKALFP